MLYTNLLATGDLFAHLAETDRACEDRLECIIRQMKKQERVTEALKAADQMEWVRRMNSIRGRAEEIVMRELIEDGLHILTDSPLREIRAKPLPYAHRPA